ncbi:MAG: ADP-forming succinate--CoA ligase subunit beta [Nitrosomonadaceae bacterium]|nr:ADP-forming succinate--CoA ligase subunit beta [Nitrosomonadaceae bacterium]
MKIHEYQAKDILREFGIATLSGAPCFSVDEAVEVARKLGGNAWAVKAQIHAGGRGKGGGVKIAKSLDEVEYFAKTILGMTLITHQTGAQGTIVQRLLVEQSINIEKEFYIGMAIDRLKQQVCLIVSSEGGMNIEETAIRTPDRIHKIFLDPIMGLSDEDADRLVCKINFPKYFETEVRLLLQNLYRLFDKNDATLVEINPLVLTTDNRILALDAKMNFDDNALFRHINIIELRDFNEENLIEIEASKYNLSYIPLDGNIGCLVNGAGLAMATMDIIKLFGGSPANFLDVGGDATVEKVTEAFRLMLRNPGLRVILINIFGGIMKCDVVAEGVVRGAQETKLLIPLVVRLEGTNVDLGKKILIESGLPITLVDNMADAAQYAVTAAKIRE